MKKKKGGIHMSFAIGPRFTRGFVNFHAAPKQANPTDPTKPTNPTNPTNPNDPIIIDESETPL